MSKGKFISICEGDDYFTDDNRLQKLVDKLIANPDCTGCFHSTYVSNEYLGKTKLEPFNQYIKEKYYFPDTITKKALFHTSAFMFYKKYLHIPAWFSHIHGGDKAIISIIAAKGPLCRVDEYMSVYRRIPASLTFNSDPVIGLKKRLFYLNQLLVDYPGRADQKIRELIFWNKKKYRNRLKSKFLDLFKKMLFKIK